MEATTRIAADKLAGRIPGALVGVARDRFVPVASPAPEPAEEPSPSDPRQALAQAWVLHRQAAAAAAAPPPSDTTAPRLAAAVAAQERHLQALGYRLGASAPSIGALPVELGTRRIVGVEALVRWTHPDWGPVAPAELLDAVEASEVMPLLTRHMLDQVAAQTHAWHERGRPLRVAVNVSMQDLHDSGLPAVISDTLRRHGLPPSCLAIEVTERLLVVDSARVARAAAEIQRIGVALSLDDFGTGYASIQQLRVLPLDEVKIDKSYVHGLAHDKAKAAIVRSVHELATALGVSVVAEGVEDAATANALARLPGVIGPGWLFGRPVSAAAFVEGNHPFRTD